VLRSACCVKRQEKPSQTRGLLFLSGKILQMRILTEIHRNNGINIHGRIIHRTAVRAVILRGRELLMVYSANVGDYKLPGGGVDDGESHEQALRREIHEECGALLEYDIPMEAEYDVFKMTSHYYPCRVDDDFGAQKLDGYEKDLGFKPVWVDIDEAISMNQSLLNSDKIPEWLKRELFVLDYIQCLM
jgi:8-oxo-dGTP pyrophosphatase MutT (NUDIX family)